MSVFSAHARGVHSPAYASRLAAECHAHWAEGRQMCEEVSLTGRPCNSRRHRVPGQATGGETNLLKLN